MNLPVLRVPASRPTTSWRPSPPRPPPAGSTSSLCTSDKDCRQLIGDRVQDAQPAQEDVHRPGELMADWGVTPEQVVDFQTLVGDSVDNVQGVPGVGPKTAAKLLQQYGTLDNLVADVDEIKQPKMKENLKKTDRIGRAGEVPQAVRLDTNVPMPLDWDGWQRHQWDGPKLVAMFRGAGLPRLREPSAWGDEGGRAGEERRVAGGDRRRGVTPQRGPLAAAQGDLFAGTPDDVTPTSSPFGGQRPPAPSRGHAWKTRLPPRSTRRRSSRTSSSSSRSRSGSPSTWRRPSLDPLRSDIVG